MSDFTLPPADGPDRPPRRDDAFEIAGSSSGDGAPTHDGPPADGFEIGGASPPDSPSRHPGDAVLADGTEQSDPTDSAAAGPPPPSPDSHIAPIFETDGPLSGRRERIARATREGGFDALPSEYSNPESPTDDWESVRSGDPFERLYLDRDQAPQIDDATVARHGVLIARFWERMGQLVETGGAARTTIVARYGDLSALHRFARQVRDDADALATAQARTAAVEARVSTLRTRTLARLEDFLLGDRTLSPAETQRLLEQAEADGWTRTAAAAFVLSEVERRDFVAPADAPQSPPEARLLAGDWAEAGATAGAADAVVASPETVLGAPLSTAMLAGSLAATQVRALLGQGEAAGLDAEACAAFVADRLGVFRDEWQPAPGEVSEEGSLAAALGSVRWLSPESMATEERRLNEDARRALDDATRQALRGGTLPAAAAARLLDGTTLDREDAARRVQALLAEREFAPTPGQSTQGSTEAARLASVDWAPKRALQDDVPSRPALWPIALLVVLAGLYLAAAGASGWPPFDRDTEFAPPTAVVITEALSVRSEPTARGGSDTLERTALSGERLEVTGWTTNDAGHRWLRVLNDGRESWVDASPQSVRFLDIDRVPEVKVIDGKVVVIEEPDGGSGGTIGSGGSGGGGSIGDGGSGGRGPERGINGDGAIGGVARNGNAGGGDSGSNTDSRGDGTPNRNNSGGDTETGGKVGDTPPDPNRIYETGLTRRARPLGHTQTVESEPGGYSGRVRLDVVVERDGSFSEPSCPPSVPTPVCLAAKRATRGDRFQAAEINGRAVRSRSSLVIQFDAPSTPVPTPEREISGTVSGSGTAAAGGGQFGLDLQSARLEPTARGTRLVVSASQSASGFGGSWTRASSIQPRISVDGATATGVMASWGEGEIGGSGSRSGQISFALPRPPSAYAGARATLTFPLDPRSGAGITVSFTLPR